MSPEERDFFMLTDGKARYTPEEAAFSLGFQIHDIPVLVTARLLVPLGHPAPNAPKYFARCDIENFKNDRKWLDKATDAIYRHWRGKNKRKSSAGPAVGSEDEEPMFAR